MLSQEETQDKPAEFIWHDGGRAASGFAGLTGDCVTRAISIATGRCYRDVYDEITSRSDRTARNGVVTFVLERFLADLGWTHHNAIDAKLQDLPRGVLLVRFAGGKHLTRGHLCCLVDHAVHDTWNPFEDSQTWYVAEYWIHPGDDAGSTSLIVATQRQATRDPGDISQAGFVKILARVKALHNTAQNDAATEGEVRNALRMMQSLMLKHNLSESAIVVDDEHDPSRFGRCSSQFGRCNREQ